MRGRKTKQESRADEFRQRLLAWKQIPESLRPSRRELARELGTSHQLLEHYLRGLEAWRHKERYRMARTKTEEIRARAKAENRPMTQAEEQQFRTLDREAIRSCIWASWLKQVKRIREDAKKGPLHRLEFKMLEVFAKQGVTGAKELLEQRAQIGVKPRKAFKKIVQETPRREGEAPLDWVRRIWDECEKYETNCSQTLTLEFLEELTGKLTTSEGNLPPAAAFRAKSFRTVESECGNSAKAEGRKSDALA